MADFKFNFISPEGDYETDISPHETEAELLPEPINVRQAKEIVLPSNFSSCLSSKGGRNGHRCQKFHDQTRE